jgi:hypothetical protein
VISDRGRDHLALYRCWRSRVPMAAEGPRQQRQRKCPQHFLGANQPQPKHEGTGAGEIADPVAPRKVIEADEEHAETQAAGRGEHNEIRAGEAWRRYRAPRTLPQQT